MTLPRKVQAVVFDMDGLLIDSESVYRDAIVAAAAQMGLDLPEAVFKRMIGLPDTGSGQVLIDHFGPDLDLQGLWADASVRFHQLGEAGVALKGGVMELLDHLDALGLPCAIATSSTHGAVRHHIDGGGIRPRFKAVIARGDYPCGKPAPDPFLAAAAALGVDPVDCLALEDSHNGVRAAHAAGMMTVMVPDLLEPTDEMHEKCVRVLESLHEVIGLLGAP
jgi:HAD superfamily hydrolase (TIGR01509 family)